MKEKKQHVGTYCDLGTRESRARVETDTIATGTAVDFDFTRIWLETQ